MSTTPAEPRPAPAGEDGPAHPDDVRGAATPGRPAVDALADAMREVMAAQRRLRARDQIACGAGGDGLTLVQVQALMHLRHADGRATAGELARAAEVSPASLSGMLDGLEDRGIVARERNAADRRVVDVSLTVDGRRLLDAKHARWRARWVDGLAGLDDDDVRAATAVLGRIAALYDGV